MQWISTRWQKHTRYYEVHLAQDLWGSWVLTQVWGRRGTALGRIINTPCASYKDGIAKLAAVRKQREQRGYLAI